MQNSSSLRSKPIPTAKIHIKGPAFSAEITQMYPCLVKSAPRKGAHLMWNAQHHTLIDHPGRSLRDEFRNKMMYFVSFKTAGPSDVLVAVPAKSGSDLYLKWWILNWNDEFCITNKWF